ncbi:hypothetical protein F5050DRAFT_1062205 [Lentinula boryana]|uniref:Uncharacterized protein n=1 Tax=Lentinula boryana TaxID=40481 RepID=A0ABQ8PZH5_9AGAR|nr:hypothetical protein F5050DRAFT_1062205 [Lentinula boryana]
MQAAHSLAITVQYKTHQLKNYLFRYSHPFRTRSLLCLLSDLRFGIYLRYASCLSLFSMQKLDLSLLMMTSLKRGPTLTVLRAAASLGITPGNPAGKRFPFSKDIKDVDVKLWRSKSTFEQWLSPNEPLTKSEKAWLCVGPDCFGLSAVSTAVMQKVSGDLTEHLKESTTIGTMSFKSFVVKAAILTPVASGDNNIPGKDLGQLKSLLEQLEEANEECTGVKIFTGHAKFEAYYKKMKELGNSG